MRFARFAALTAVALAMLIAPLDGETQQAGKVRPYRLGVLHPAFGEITPAVKGLKAGLKAAAVEEGRDVVFDIQLTRGEIHALPAAARALSLAGVLIFSVGEAATRAALAETSTIPIVFVGVGDNRPRRSRSDRAALFSKARWEHGVLE